MKPFELKQLGKVMTGQPTVIFFNRMSLFIVFFWFGLLKVLFISPAEGLVLHLHEEILGSLIAQQDFLLMLGLLECMIGILWLFPKMTKLVFALFSIQMITTFMPLIFLPKETWQNTFVLTLTGQYIIKNLVLVASAFTVISFERNLQLRTNFSN
jgi:uncharacterized membrane protein YkgB